MKLTGLPKILALCVLVSTVALAQDQERIANEGSIGDKWMLAEGVKLAMAEYPAHLAARGDDVCLALSYRIRPNGTTSDFAVLEQWNSETGATEPVDGFWQAFAQAGAAAVGQWRFKPRPGVRPQVTHSAATITFKGGKPNAQGDAAQHCRVKNLATLLRSHKTLDPLKRSLTSRDLEQYNRTHQNLSNLKEHPGFQK